LGSIYVRTDDSIDLATVLGTADTTSANNCGRGNVSGIAHKKRLYGDMETRYVYRMEGGVSCNGTVDSRLEHVSVWP
jgi:hypothetical protein